MNGAVSPAAIGRRLVRLQRVYRALETLKSAPKIPTAIVGLSIFLAIFADLIVPHSPVDINPREGELPPAFVSDGNWNYVLGTDRKGRDILSRILTGTRISLAVAGAAIVLAGVLGTTLGLIAGYKGGWVDALIMRVVDGMLAFPSILLALVLAITVGPGFWVVVIVLVLIVWARYARLVRGETLVLRDRDFVLLARVSGASGPYIVIRHILPMVMNSVVVLSTLQVGWAILVEASLGFLGVGIPPPTPTWGSMVAEGRDFVESAWWISVFPGIAIILVVLAFNLFGDWLRDVLDPKLRQL